MRLILATLLLRYVSGAADSGVNPAKPGESFFPQWLKFGVEMRGRVSAPAGAGFQSGADDLYYENRIRLNVTVRPLPWLRFFAQGQDTRVFLCKPFTGSQQDPADLRQAYI